MRSEFLKVFAFLILVGLVPAWSQTAVLEGKILDAVESSPIAGADVAVVSPDGKVQKATISGANGAYSIEDLKQGKQVTVKYRKGGYAPDPRPYEVALSRARNVQDAKLFRNTADSLYWGTWSRQVKQFVEAHAAEPNRRADMYNAIWSELSKFGLPPDAQVEAARQIIEVAPNLARSRELQDFATADIKAVHTCTSKIQAAVQGSAKLSPCELTPPDLASEIAATEVYKRPPPEESRERFFREYREMWGEKSTEQLHQKITDKGRFETEGYTPPETSPEQQMPR